jgi:ubiquinone/menaquinone biosynthesis C-methylase UbiE
MAGFYAQFANPQGPLGWLVGQMMAVKNGKRSAWALSLLDAQPGEQILEVGFGPGVDVRRLSAVVGAAGRVSGVDVSGEMVRQARTRNAGAIQGGRVDLRLGDVTELPFANEAFDAVYSTNCAQFWSDLTLGMREVRRVLRPSGRAVIVVQPMARGSVDADAVRWQRKLIVGAEEAGFARIEGKIQPMWPTAASGLVVRR